MNWFTEWVARPPAAVVVWGLLNTRITPNQVTFLSALVAVVASVMFALVPGWGWAVAAAALFEFSFVLDCADGQLARHRKIASPVGHLLDFLMDELKAMWLFACITVRLWRWGGLDLPAGWAPELILVIGLFALFSLASGISLTSFMRRPEFTGKAEADLVEAAPARRSLVGRLVGLVEAAARFVVHYPQYLWLIALLGRFDVYFWAYAAVNVLYLGKTLATIVLRLGRFAPRAQGVI